MDQRLIELQHSYDQVAEEYVARIFHELEHKPLDRELLDRFAANVRDSGLVCDLGCGPGHVARYLHDRGVNVFGIDLSPRKVSLDSIFFERHEMEGYLKSAGFVIEDVIERPPYENVEYPSHRACIFARKS